VAALFMHVACGRAASYGDVATDTLCSSCFIDDAILTHNGRYGVMVAESDVMCTG